MRQVRNILSLFIILNLIACSDNAPQKLTKDSLPIQEDNIITPITDKEITGNVRNTKFDIEQAIIDNGTLTLRQGKDFFADISVDIIIFDNEDMSGKTFNSSDSSILLKPHIYLNLKKEGQGIPDTTILMSDYELLLIYGKKESLGIPFSIKLVSLNNGTNIEGTFFATYKDIKLVNGEIDLKSDSFDTLEYLANEHIKKEYGEIELGKRFGVTTTAYGDDNPKSGFVGYEADTGKPSLIKIQLLKNESGWEVTNQLNANQIHQAHPVVVDIEGNLRTTEGLKAITAAARKLESFLNDESLIDAIRSTSVGCYLTKTAHKASCRAIYGLKTNDSVECHNINYLLSNDGESWIFESEILDTQRVDYNSGELVSKKPFSMHCV